MKRILYRTGAYAHDVLVLATALDDGESTFHSVRCVPHATGHVSLREEWQGGIGIPRWPANRADNDIAGDAQPILGA